MKTPSKTPVPPYKLDNFLRLTPSKTDNFSRLANVSWTTSPRLAEMSWTAFFAQTDNFPSSLRTTSPTPAKQALKPLPVRGDA